MGRDRHGPPPGLSEEERRRWWQWRKFTWLPGDIVITRNGQRLEGRAEEAHEEQDEQPGDAGTR